MGNVSRYDQNADAVDHLTLECGAHGYSRAQIAACIGISKERLNVWARDNARFAEVLERATTLAQAWWEGRAMDGTAQAKIGGTVWHKSVAARFPHEYADRQEIGPMGGAGRASEVRWTVVDPKEPET
jgi:transcriptional regulator with XRE-family HTH domain